MCVKNRRLLDREKKSRYELVVKASNKNASVWSTVPCHITIRDVNDHRPEFLDVEYKFYVPEKNTNTVDSLLVVNNGKKQAPSRSLMHYVGNVRAIDRDASPSELVYYLDPASSEAFLELNTNGAVDVAYSFDNVSSTLPSPVDVDLDNFEFADNTVYEVVAIRQNADLGAEHDHADQVFNFTSKDSPVGKKKKVHSHKRQE